MASGDEKSFNSSGDWGVSLFTAKVAYLAGVSFAVFLFFGIAVERVCFSHGGAQIKYGNARMDLGLGRLLFV